MSLALIATQRLYVSNTEIKSLNNFEEIPFNHEIKAVWVDNGSYQISLLSNIVILDTNNKLWVRGFSLTTDSTKNFVPFLPEVTFTKVAITDADSVLCAIDTNGYLWSYGIPWTFWGLSEEGNYDETPYQVSQTQKFVDISFGGDLFMAVENTGSLWGFGQNKYFTLGLNEKDKRLKTFTLICEGDFVAVSCSKYHTLCLDSNGNVWGTGSNDMNELAFKNVDEVPNFTQMSHGIPIKSIAAGVGMSILLSRSGRVFACGLVGAREKKEAEYLELMIPGGGPFEQIVVSGTKTLVKDYKGQVFIIDGISNSKYAKVDIPNLGGLLNVSLMNQKIF